MATTRCFGRKKAQLMGKSVEWRSTERQKAEMGAEKPKGKEAQVANKGDKNGKDVRQWN